jgi:hypothetical protein
MKRSRFLLFLATLFALVAPFATATQLTLQFPEDDSIVRTLDGTSPTRLCRNNARWIRLGFEALQLQGGDRLELIGASGDTLVFEGTRWNDRRFHARALRGSCVTLKASFANADSHYRLSDYHAGMQALEATESTIAGAGDLCDSTPEDCRKTSDLVVAINPVVAFVLGDNAYTNGTLSEFNTLYDPNWGRFKDITTPIPGNHEYLTPGAAGDQRTVRSDIC